MHAIFSFFFFFLRHFYWCLFLLVLSQSHSLSALCTHQLVIYFSLFNLVRIVLFICYFCSLFFFFLLPRKKMFMRIKLTRFETVEKGKRKTENEKCIYQQRKRLKRENRARARRNCRLEIGKSSTLSFDCNMVRETAAHHYYCGRATAMAAAAATAVALVVVVMSTIMPHFIFTHCHFIFRQFSSSSSSFSSCHLRFFICCYYRGCRSSC